MSRITIGVGTVVFTAAFLGVSAVTGLVLGLEARYTTRQQPVLDAVDELRSEMTTMDRRRNAQYGEVRALINEVSADVKQSFNAD